MSVRKFSLLRQLGLHPLTKFMAMAVWAWGAYQLNGMVWLVVWLCLALWLVAGARSDGRIRLKSLARLVLVTAAMVALFTLVTALFTSADGGAGVLWWHGPRVPGIGSLSLGPAGVRRGLVASLRIWTLLLGITALTRHVQAEDVTGLLGRRFARVGLTIAMVITFLPLLQQERRRLAEYVWLRGGISEGAAWSTRLRGSAAVAQALLANGLERSWVLAESMYVRGYGTTAPTQLESPRWHRVDTVVWTGWLVAVGCVVWAGIQRAHLAAPSAGGLAAGSATLLDPISWNIASLVGNVLILCLMWWVGRPRDDSTH